MLTTDVPTPRRALAIGAHPDDVEFGCGATLAKWAGGGCEVHHLICTDGSKGSWDPSQDTAELVALRRREQRAAAASLGATGQCVFLQGIDGELESDLRRRWEVAYWIRRLRPDVVLGHDPWKRWRLHPDHRHAGILAVDGIVAARDPHFFPEQDLPSHRPTTLLLWEADEVDHVEVVGEDAIRLKVAALLEHRSQYRSTHDIHDPEDPLQIERFASWVAHHQQLEGEIVGVPAGEAFKRIDRL